VEKDFLAAATWYHKAAAQNVAVAQLLLGNCYYKGRGVAKDYVQAVKWYRRAAEQNNAKAQYSLGLCYAVGDGVAEDNVQGYKWLLLAAEKGNKDAKSVLTTLANEMTRWQIADGQKLARGFHPREVTPAGER